MPQTQKTLEAVEAELSSTTSEFNTAIDYAIKLGIGASTFLETWREGDWEAIASEWPDFKLPAAATRHAAPGVPA